MLKEIDGCYYYMQEESLNEDQKILLGEYEIKAPLIKRSKLACREKGGIGKELSEGWALNFSIGCTHGCLFCYVDSIHRRYRGKAMGFNEKDWGQYLFIPNNIPDVIEKTNWSRWNDKEVLMSSTHDPFLPQLEKYSRMILEEALPNGVRFCFQTRSTLIMNHMDLLKEYKDQIRIQVSIATYNEDFSRMIEPRVASPKERMDIIRESKKQGMNVGVILAPIFPNIDLRPNVGKDLDDMISDLEEIQPDHIYGEMLHLRGKNLKFIEEKLNIFFNKSELLINDEMLEDLFYSTLRDHGLVGTWWPEHKKK